MERKQVLLISDTPLLGDPASFVGRYGYTQYYGPIRSEELTSQFLRTLLLDVDFFWVETNNLDKPVVFEPVSSSNSAYGQRRMFLVKAVAEIKKT